MAFVDFNLSQEIAEDNPNEFTVHAYFCRGHYEDMLNEITNETESVFVRDERFKEVSVKFIPGETTREELYVNLYDMLLQEKNSNDEVIPECVYL